MMFDIHVKETTKISTREKEVLELIARGFTCEEIATQLKISSTTVITHRNNMKQKLGVKNSCELIFCGCKLDLI